MATLRGSGYFTSSPALATSCARCRCEIVFIDRCFTSTTYIRACATTQEILKSSAAATGGRQAEALSLLSRLRKAVQSHILTESQILEALFRYPQVVSWLYDQVRRCAPL